MQNIFTLGKYSDIWSDGDTEWAYFFRFAQKQHRNDETEVMQLYYMSRCYLLYDQSISEKAEEFQNKSEKTP